MSKILQAHFKSQKWASFNTDFGEIFSCYKEQLMKLLEENNIVKPYPKIIEDAIVESQDYLTKNYDKAIKEYQSKRSRYLINISNNETYSVS